MKTPKKNFIQSSLDYYFYPNSLPHILLTSTLIRCSFLSTQCKTCLLKRSASTLISALVCFCCKTHQANFGSLSEFWRQDIRTGNPKSAWCVLSIGVGVFACLLCPRFTKCFYSSQMSTTLFCETPRRKGSLVSAWSSLYGERRRSPCLR